LEASEEASTTASLCGTIRSSPRKQSGCNKIGCNHADIHEFENYGEGSHNSYFEPKYLAVREFFPRNCAICKRKFVLKKQIECSDKEWSVRDGKVRLCKIGANSAKEECTYGLCGECSEKIGVVTPQTRKKRPSRKAISC
jgi:hypothetical protein